MSRIAEWFLQTSQNFLRWFNRTTHGYVIGAPGTGKTRAMESWIMQDIKNGDGVCVVDPHQDLFQRLLYRIAELPQVWERVVIINPCDTKWTVSFNPLEAFLGISDERLALFLTDVIVKIWKLEIATSPRLVWLLTNTFLALADLALTLLDLPRFLLDEDFRMSLLPNIQNERARMFFEHEFPTSKGARHQWVTPVLNKLGALLYDADLRLIFAGKSKVNFRELMENQCIVLVNIPKGILGELPSSLIGAFIVAHIQKAALSRADTVYRPPFYLYLDEFQNYTTDNILDILSESRKYALSAILAHQYLDQLTPEFRSAVLNTAGNLICFRVGYGDASRLAKDIFPSPDFIKTRTSLLKLQRRSGFPMPSLLTREKPIGWDGLAQILTRLGPREFWYRRRGTWSPHKFRTLDMPDPIITPELRKKRRELINYSGERFGRLKQELLQELDASEPEQTSNNTSDQVEEQNSFWSE